jgi:predicted acetyltransferase
MTPGMRLRLRPLRLEDETEARLAHAELALDGFTFLLSLDRSDSWEDYLALRRREVRGDDLDDWIVPSTLLVAELDGHIVGRASIRFELNDVLRHEGGHIGIGVRPAWRAQGVGTEILRQALVVARSHGVDRALVTCNDGNLASAAMIERGGGVLEDVVQPVEGEMPVRRYWIG